MLSHPDDRPNDPQLGCDFSALDPDAILETLRNADELASVEDRGRWTTCRVLEAMYDPGQHLRVAYALNEDATVLSQRVWPQGDIVYLRFPTRETMSRRGIHIRVGGRDMEAYLFPNDRRLVGVRKFARRERVAKTWQQWMRQDEPTLDLCAETLRRSLLRYVPEQKWIVQLHAKCEDSISQSVEKRSVAVLCTDVEVCKKLYRRAIALRRAFADCNDALRIARPVALDDTLGMLATRWVWGQPLLKMLTDADPAVIFQSVAAGLQRFHSTPLEDAPVQRVTDWVSSVTQCVTDLMHVLPTRSRSLRALADDLITRRPPDAREPCTIHNDFHWKQLCGKPKRLALLDIDRCARGDACVDIANFTAQLLILPLRHDLSVSTETAQQWATAFLDAWENVSGQSPDAEKMRWYSAASLLILARGMMRHLRDGWRELAETCIERADQTLNNRMDLRVPL